jgi:hypothetical protein
MRNIVLIVAVLLGCCGPAWAQTRLERPRRRSYVEQKNEQVMRAFLTFRVARDVADEQNGLQLMRDRDELLLPAGGVPQGRSGAYGAAMLGAAVVLSAHAPAPLRPIFDARVHVGPAIFDGGGMGAGVGGRF